MPPKRSRSRAIVPAAVSTPLLQFANHENANWYKDRQQYKVVVEKSVSDDVNSRYRIRDHFVSFGWGMIFDLPDSIYGGLVREFYANIEDKKNLESTVIRSTVQNIPIVLNAELLSQILGGETSAGLFDVELERMKDDITFDFSVAYSHFQLEQVKTQTIGHDDWFNTDRYQRNRYRYPATGLEVRVRAILYFLHNNVLPAAHVTVVRRKDVYLLYRLLVGLADQPKPALGPIIIQCMRRVSGDKIHAFLYPRLLTLVFNYFGVPLASHISQDCSNEMLTAARLHRMSNPTTRTTRSVRGNESNPAAGTSEVPRSEWSWQDWATHFDARLNDQEDMLHKILKKLGEPDSDAHPSSPSSS